MPLTVSTELPVFAMVSVLCELEATVTSPNAKSPLNEMTRVGVAIPVPETALVAVPLVASELTVRLPL
jgi:hypothetical protein